MSCPGRIPHRGLVAPGILKEKRRGRSRQVAAEGCRLCQGPFRALDRLRRVTCHNSGGGAPNAARPAAALSQPAALRKATPLPQLGPSTTSGTRAEPRARRRLTLGKMAEEARFQAGRRLGSGSRPRPGLCCCPSASAASRTGG